VIVVVGPDRPPLLAADADCTAFHVHHVGGDLAAGLASIGGALLDDGDALVGLAWVRAMSSAPREALDGMLTYAETKGWLSEDRTTIRGHVERDG
jgi:hypothetical protein